MARSWGYVNEGVHSACTRRPALGKRGRVSCEDGYRTMMPSRLEACSPRDADHQTRTNWSRRVLLAAGAMVLAVVAATWYEYAASAFAGSYLGGQTSLQIIDQWSHLGSRAIGVLGLVLACNALGVRVHRWLLWVAVAAVAAVLGLVLTPTVVAMVRGGLIGAGSTVAQGYAGAAACAALVLIAQAIWSRRSGERSEYLHGEDRDCLGAGNERGQGPVSMARVLLALGCGMVAAVLGGSTLAALLGATVFAGSNDIASWAMWLWWGLLAVPFVGAIACGVCSALFVYSVAGGKLGPRIRRRCVIGGGVLLGMVTGSIVAYLVRADVYGAVGDVFPPLSVYMGIIVGARLGAKAAG